MEKKYTYSWNFKYENKIRKKESSDDTPIRLLCK